MTHLLDLLRSPWPWYVSGPLIGLTVPVLLLIGNRSFGVSANLRHTCAILLPAAARPSFFRYDWRAERWNLTFAAGLIIGGLLASLLTPPAAPQLTPAGLTVMRDLGVAVRPDLLPAEMTDLTRPATWGLLALSGLLVGFGTRYGGGCTSGHAITGLSTLQRPSLIATASFFAGGTLSAQLLLPALLGGAS